MVPGRFWLLPRQRDDACSSMLEDWCAHLQPSMARRKDFHTLPVGVHKRQARAVLLRAGLTCPLKCRPDDGPMTAEEAVFIRRFLEIDRTRLTTTGWVSEVVENR